MTPQENRLRTVLISFGSIFLLLVYLSLHISHALYPSETADMQTGGQFTSFGGHTTSAPASQKSETDIMSALIEGMNTAMSDPLGFTPVNVKVLIPISIFLIIELCIGGYLITYKQVNGEDAAGKEHGSAKWAVNISGFLKGFSDPYDSKKDETDPNVIISDRLRMSFDISRIDNKRNLNTLVVGGSGAGKSFRFVKPNLAQMNCSTVTTDPSGELLECMGKPLMQKGIKVKVFSTSDMKHSNCYNPFDYVYDENGEIDEAKVSTMVFLFLKNADGAQAAKQKSGDPFWEKSAKAFLSALAYYLLENRELKKECINFTTMLKLTQAGKVSEDSQSSSSQLDRMMEEHRAQMAKEGRISKAMLSYDTFKLAPAKTANSILITCAVDLQLFANEDVKNMTRHDYEDEDNNVHLDKIGDVQTALFINIPQANGTFNFLVSMLYSQMFDALYTKAEKICPNRYMIVDKHKKPVITMLKDEETARKYLEMLKDATVVRKATVRGRETYRVMSGKTVITERPSQEAAQKVIDGAGEYTVKQGRLRLPWHVRCLMDEFANIGEIPEFSQKLATMRKYEISCCIIVQSIAQIEEKYDKLYEGIIGNCDTIIYLGSNEYKTCKYISDLLGETTIRTKNRSRSKKGSSDSFAASKRLLMTPDEIRRLNRRKCIVIISGLDPFLDRKYNFLKHPNFKLCGDADRKNKADMKFMDIYFNSTPSKKRSTSKTGRQKAVAETVGKSRYSQPKTKQETVETFAPTEEEALKKTTTVPPTPENEKAMEDYVNGIPEKTDTAATDSSVRSTTDTENGSAENSDGVSRTEMSENDKIFLF